MLTIKISFLQAMSDTTQASAVPQASKPPKPDTNNIVLLKTKVMCTE
jgi:hypothetical protein